MAVRANRNARQRVASAREAVSAWDDADARGDALSVLNALAFHADEQRDALVNRATFDDLPPATAAALWALLEQPDEVGSPAESQDRGKR